MASSGKDAVEHEVLLKSSGLELLRREEEGSVKVNPKASVGADEPIWGRQ